MNLWIEKFIAIIILLPLPLNDYIMRHSKHIGPVCIFATDRYYPMEKKDWALVVLTTLILGLVIAYV